MPFRHISKDIKDCALWLLDNDYLTEDVCEILGVSGRSLCHWRSNDEVYGSVIPPRNPDQGRPRILNADQTHDILTLLEEAPELYLDEIQDWLGLVHDVAISKSSINQIIADCGVSYKMLRRAAAERDDVAHQVWRGSVTLSERPELGTVVGVFQEGFRMA